MKTIGMLIAVLAGLAGVPHAFAQQLGPDELVQQVTNDVLATIQSDPALQAGDRAKALALAEEKVLPHVDFEGMTQLAAGRAWRTATPEQRAALVREFRGLLIRTYSAAVGPYRGQKMVVEPTRMTQGATEVTVRNRYVRSGGPPVLVDYAMRKTETGWKVIDIVVEGISLVVTYRSSFDEEIRQGGVERLIARLTEKNRPPAASR